MSENNTVMHDSLCEEAADANFLRAECRCKERTIATENATLRARLAEAITMLSERDFEYNRKANALIERRAKQIEGLLARLAEAVKWARERGHRKDCEIHRSYLYKERPCSCGLNQIVRPTDSATDRNAGTPAGERRLALGAARHKGVGASATDSADEVQP